MVRMRILLLPYLSLIGPMNRMLNESTSMNMYRDMFRVASSVLKSNTICGNPDRYMSVDNGPNTLSRMIRNISGTVPSLMMPDNVEPEKYLSLSMNDVVSQQ